MNGFEPRIVCLLCKWCSYTCVDLAGVGKAQYPPNLIIVPVLCTGRVDPAIILVALADGADGVIVVGCNIGGVNCLAGNPQTKRKFSLVKRMVEVAGLESERIKLDWMSASDAQRFADMARSFTEKIRRIGPSPLSGGSPAPHLLLNMRAATSAVEDFRLRTLVGKEEKVTTEGNVYGELLAQEEFDDKMAQAARSEYERHRIRLALLDEPSSVKKLSLKLGIEPRQVLRDIVVIRQRGWIDVRNIEGSSPIYGAQEVQR